MIELINVEDLYECDEIIVMDTTFSQKQQIN